jgi:hypothetical protein
MLVPFGERGMLRGMRGMWMTWRDGSAHFIPFPTISWIHDPPHLEMPTIPMGNDGFKNEAFWVGARELLFNTKLTSTSGPDNVRRIALDNCH